AVWDAAPLTPTEDTRLRVGVGAELGDQPALPDAGLPNDRHELNRALLGGALENADQKRFLELTPDERGPEAVADVASEAAARAQRVPERDRLGFSLDLHRVKRLVVEDAP